MEDKSLPASTEQPSTPQPTSTPTATPTLTFQGNTYDILAIVAATVAGVVLLSCLTLNYAIYCLPVVAVILGVIAVLKADASVDPKRTRLWGWVGTGVGAVVSLIVLAVIAIVVIFYGWMFSSIFRNTPFP